VLQRHGLRLRRLRAHRCPSTSGYMVSVLLAWFCLLELEENGQGGLTLDAGLLGRLGALPVDLTLDLYG
jgi:hypothetical protein